MDLKDIIALDEQYYMNCFGHRSEVSFTHGEGVTLYDTEGNSYTDFLAGIAVNCLGYGDKGLSQTIADQAANMIHSSSLFYIESQAKAAKMLCDATGYDRVFFSNSGAEAVEGAMKLARKYFFEKGENRYEFITMKNSFHGRTLATLFATGQDKFHKAFAPGVPSFKYAEYGDVESAKALITENTCAILLEPVQGEGGVICADDEYLKGIRQLADDAGILLIFDEIQTGMGRTGSLLCSTGAGVKGDIVTMAKALGGGVPLGAFLSTEEVASAMKPSDHGSTFGGNQIATAAACYTLSKVATDEMMARVRSIGEYFKGKLEGVCAQFPKIALEARGKGLLLGLKLADSIPAKEIVGELLKKGFVCCTAGQNCLRFLPPYIIQEKHVDALISALSAILAAK